MIDQRQQLEFFLLFTPQRKPDSLNMRQDHLLNQFLRKYFSRQNKFPTANGQRFCCFPLNLTRINAEGSDECVIHVPIECSSHYGKSRADCHRRWMWETMGRMMEEEEEEEYDDDADRKRRRKGES